MSSEQPVATPDADHQEPERNVYRVLHQAFKYEYVVAESPGEAREAAAGGYDTGEYNYGEIAELPEQLDAVENLTDLPQVGKTTVDKLLEADSAVPLGPASKTDVIHKADVTRLRNKLSEQGRTTNLRFSDD